MNRKYIFDIISEKWEKISNTFTPLHIINNIRFNYIKNKTIIKKKTILDLGCGGGILTEKLAKHGAKVIGLDKSKDLIKIANTRKVAVKNYNIKYINCSLHNFTKNYKKKFDIIICMEIIEHIKNKNQLIKLIKKMSHENSVIILSSLNKNILAYIYMILFGEYITKKITQNTHNYQDFIKLKQIKEYTKLNKFEISDIKELIYNPILNFAKIGFTPKINYILTFKNEKTY